MRHRVQSFLSLLLAGSLGLGSAATSVIGVVNARGNFQIDNARVYRHSTLFEGSAVETEQVASELRLNNGAQLLLASGSRGTVYRDHIVLEWGAGQLTGAGNFLIQARGLRIEPTGPGSEVQVALSERKHVQVAARKGTARVRTAEGVVVANLMPGRALDLEPQAEGAAAPARLTGCLERKNGKFILTDEATNVTVELQGDGLDQQEGNVIEITGATIPGATPVPNATQVIRVSDLKATARKCAAGTGAAGAGAAGAAGAGAAVAAGLSTAATVAIIGGVAAAVTVGLAATGTFEEGKAPASP